MLLHLGFEGYRAVALQDLKNARTLSRALERSGYYEVLSDIHRYDQSPGSVLSGAKQAIGINEEDIEVSNTLLFLLRLLTHIPIELYTGPSRCRIQVRRFIP